MNPTEEQKVELVRCLLRIGFFLYFSFRNEFTTLLEHALLDALSQSLVHWTIIHVVPVFALTFIKVSYQQQSR